MHPDKKVIRYSFEEMKSMWAMGKPPSGVASSDVFNGWRGEGGGGVEGRRLIAAGRGRFLPVLMTLQPSGKGWGAGRGRPHFACSEGSSAELLSSATSTPELAPTSVGLNPNAKAWTPPPTPSPPLSHLPPSAYTPSPVLGRPLAPPPPTCFPYSFPISVPGYRTSANPPPTTVS